MVPRRRTHRLFLCWSLPLLLLAQAPLERVGGGGEFEGASIRAASLSDAGASSAAGWSVEVPDPFPVGPGVMEAEFDGTSLNLYSYKPESYTGERFILLLHGASRAAARYRDDASRMAEEFRALVVVPEFDAVRFPNRMYQFGGVFREDGTLADPEERTYAYIPKLVEYIRAREGTPRLPYLLLGFSAGGQFVSRMAAFLDVDAERLLVISPGSCMFPTREMEFGLGFGGLPDELNSDERIQRYLGLPITIYVGTNDTEMAQLPTGEAYAQGVHRYSRNLRYFNEAMDLAYQRDWDFNWRLVIADGPGHSPPDMFNHPQIANALIGHREGRLPPF